MEKDRLIIGFTGPIGSGCSEATKFLSNEHKFSRYSLSDFVRAEAIARGFKDPTREQLQNIGNELRQKHGGNYFASRAIKKIEEEQCQTEKKPITIDSIRNVGEVYEFRKFSNFFLFAIDAPKDDRWGRLKEKYHGRRDIFEIDEERDRNEKGLEYGQQVEKCVYLADVHIQNSSNFTLKQYRDKLTECLESIEKKTIPKEHEVFMTLAYCESMRSSCLKRQVGAVITTKNGEIISSGFNDVPTGEKTCKEAYGECYRDRRKVEYVRKIKYCPKCGTQFLIGFNCPKCQQKISEYAVRCPNSDCSVMFDIPIKCSNCKEDIEKSFIPKELDRCRALHAEETAIIKMSKIGSGLSLGESVLYTTTFPCILCANKIAEAGIRRVVYVHPYPYTEDDVNRIFNNPAINIELEPFEGVKARAYFRFYDKFV